jgi:hypothetical protein
MIFVSVCLICIIFAVSRVFCPTNRHFSPFPNSNSQASFLIRAASHLLRVL